MVRTGSHHCFHRDNGYINDCLFAPNEAHHTQHCYYCNRCGCHCYCTYFWAVPIVCGNPYQIPAGELDVVQTRDFFAEIFPRVAMGNGVLTRVGGILERNGWTDDHWPAKGCVVERHREDRKAEGIRLSSWSRRNLGLRASSYEGSVRVGNGSHVERKSVRSSEYAQGCCPRIPRGASKAHISRWWTEPARDHSYNRSINSTRWTGSHQSDTTREERSRTSSHRSSGYSASGDGSLLLSNGDGRLGRPGMTFASDVGSGSYRGHGHEGSRKESRSSPGSVLYRAASVITRVGY